MACKADICMRHLEDLGLLFILALMSLLFIPITITSVICLLCAIFVCCIDFVVSIPQIRIIVLVAYLATGLICPQCLCYGPIIIYMFLKEHCYVGAIGGSIYLILYWIYFKTPELPLLLICLFALILAIVLQLRTSKYQQLLDNFYKLHDDSTEDHLQLSKTNHMLMETQDYKIYAATLQERNRIAREIHDNVGHILSRSILMVGAMKAVDKNSPLTPMIENLDNSLNSAMDSIRNSVHDLHDDSIDLAEAVNLLINDFSFCPVDLTYDMSRNIPKSVKFCFIAIVKEALSNIIKHSNATKVTILMREHPGLYQLSVEDNGSIVHKKSQSSGIGMINMQDRVNALKGYFQISNDKGFKIYITIPKET